jgi:hypothetical protein
MPESTTARSESAGSGPRSRQQGATPLGGRIAGARSELASLDQRTRRIARERPFLLLGGALLTGYLVGRLMSRL